MKKIKTLFERNLSTHLIEPTVTHGCEWVMFGEGESNRQDRRNVLYPHRARRLHEAPRSEGRKARASWLR